jgi:hypothetical protein
MPVPSSLRPPGLTYEQIASELGYADNSCHVRTKGARRRQSGQGEDETGNGEGAGHDPILSVGAWRPGASLLQESASLSRNDEDPDTKLMPHSPRLAMGPDPRSPRMARPAASVI